MSETLPDLETKAVELIEKFEALAVDIAPDAMELALDVARIAAASQIALGLLLVLFAVGFYKATWKAWAFSRGGEKYSVQHDGGMAMAIISGITSGILSIVGIIQILNIWAWAGVFYPELWIAKQVLGW